MTYAQRSLEALDTASGTFPWFHALKAMIFALLAIAVAVESLKREE